MRAKTLLFAALLFSLCGCDWYHYAMVNSIPFRGRTEINPDVYVYLGVDGLAYRSVQEARQRGAFAQPDWKLAKFISMFPATSDASWTRILHTEALGGYEFEYYDRAQDKVVNGGLFGVAMHVLPNFAEFLAFDGKYLRAWDYYANGYTHDIGAYHDTFYNLAESLDNFFFLLDGRSQTVSVFTGYLIEFDVLGHTQSYAGVTDELMKLADRIEKFKAAHPERRFHFTLFSDHGMDFLPVAKDHLVVLSQEMAKVGVTPVESLTGHDPGREIFAIPIEHVRVTYLALHTSPVIADEVARRLSRLPSIDLSVARCTAPAARAGENWFWYGVWAEGKPALCFGYDPAGDRYFIPAVTDWKRLGLTALGATVPPDSDWLELSGTQAFQGTMDTRYPDLFYRVRTGLSALGTQTPADVLVSFRPGYVSMGFQLPGGGDDIATRGFHGSLEALGSEGTLLSEERDLPAHVRSETFGNLFPRFEQHVREKGAFRRAGDPHEDPR